MERPDPLTPPGASASDAPGSPPGTTPSPTPAPKAGGTQRIKLRTVGVRLDVPAAWLVLAGDELTAVEELPAVAQAMAGVEDGSLVLLGADVLPDATCSVGTLVTVVDLGEAVPDRALAAAAGVLATGLESLPEVTGEVKVSSVDLPIGPAQRLTFQVEATADGAVVAWWVRLDVLTASGHTLALGSAAPEAAVDAARPLVNAVAKSLREL